MEEWNGLDEGTKDATECWVYDTDGWAYWSKAINPGEATGPLLRSIENKNLAEIFKYLENDFELVAPSVIFEIKNKLKDNGALNSLMTGSGSAVFGIFANEEKANYAKEKLEEIYDKVYISRSVDKW